MTVQAEQQPKRLIDIANRGGAFGDSQLDKPVVAAPEQAAERTELSDIFEFVSDHLPHDVAARLELVRSKYEGQREKVGEDAAEQLATELRFLTPELGGKKFAKNVEESTSYIQTQKELRVKRDGVTRGLFIAYDIEEPLIKPIYGETADVRMDREKRGIIEDAANGFLDNQMSAVRRSADKKVLELLKSGKDSPVPEFARSAQARFDERMKQALGVLLGVAEGREPVHTPVNDGTHKKRILGSLGMGGYKPRHSAQTEAADIAMDNLSRAMKEVEEVLKPVKYERGEMLAYVTSNHKIDGEKAKSLIDEAVREAVADSADLSTFRMRLRQALRIGVIAEMRDRRTDRIILQPSEIDFTGKKTHPHKGQEVALYDPKSDKLGELSEYLKEREKQQTHYADLAEGRNVAIRAEDPEEEKIRRTVTLRRLERQAVRYVAEQREANPAVTDSKLLAEVSHYLHPDRRRWPVWEGGSLPQSIEQLGFEDVYKIFQESIETT